MKFRIFKLMKIYSILIFLGLIYCLVIKKTNFRIPCIFRKITGLKCPGCGITDFFLYLFNLDAVSAFKCNIAMIIIFPVLVYILIIQNIKYITKNDSKFEFKYVKSGYILVFLLIIYTFIRNIFNF
ncbi:MAG: DUF2752 domain-containing protein [Candidatus Paraimprobicoccus trichonymphae]|uniref:DUF2752 domain-containing protein n=1 Tax=Candidatus Paraimprobicoccus trichonymphae TaxID=3033793 RepID=A0AA48I690_9FIRM|nr:MAG: DUF2752 domain-containing protein [Candidatus Paraimprobicoccus trichonymphae]